MKWTTWIFGSLTAVCIAGCNGSGRQNNDTGAAAGTGTDSAAIQSGATGTGADTGMGASMSADTAMGGSMGSDTARSGSRMKADTSGTAGKKSSTGKINPNQTKSGVTDTKTGESTLGEGVNKTSPDQGQPVTSKGDTIQAGGDSTAGSSQ
jgi:hypothetical protein